MKILKIIYTYWSIFWVVVIFLLLFPFYFVATLRPSWHKLSFYVNKVWARVFYIMVFCPSKTVWKFKRKKGQACMYCPNHFSFMDIPIMGLTMPAFFVFVGKFELGKVPLFGYMFNRIHIAINRDSRKSRYETYDKAKEALRQGKNLVIYPEGGIWAKQEEMPKLARLKDGPFKIAIEEQVPIIPVSIPYNWKFLPYPNKYLNAPKIAKVIYHEPIETKGLDLSAVPALKEKYIKIVEESLIQHDKK